MTVTAMTGSMALDQRGSAREQDLTTSDAFAALVTRQSRFVFRVAYAVLRNPHDAEDVVQETFLKLYRSGHWRSVENEKAFLAKAAWRVAVERRRKTAPGESAELELASGAADPESAAISADWNAAVRRLVDALPEELRQPLALSALEEWNSRQIAEVMDIPEATVRGRLMRARQILRQKLEFLKAGHHGK
jgi:RNA polymerase sigma-70 factor (ECF subfamily)